MPSGQSKSSGGRLVYAITIVPLLATLGYYFLEYVPAREEYFLNLRFRTLGVIGKQIETKLEAVSSGLTYGESVSRIPQAQADATPQAKPIEEYVRLVFPGLEPHESQNEEAKEKMAAGAKESDIDPEIRFVGNADRVRFSVGPAEKRWEDSLAHLIRPLTEEVSFDDVLLAEPAKNLVLFQRSDSTPKLRDVSDMLKKPGTSESGVLNLFHRLNSEGSGSDTDLLRAVELDGSAYQFLAQPLTMQVPRSPSGKVSELLLCGLVRSDRIRQEAMHVPPKYLLWVIVPLFAGVLSGPLLKLILIRRTGRFETRDVPLLTLFSSLAMAMLTVVLLAYHFSTSNGERIKLGSKNLADLLTQQVLECFRWDREVLNQVDQFAVELDATRQAQRVAMNRTRIWSWTDLIKKAPTIRNRNLEFIFWTDAQGFQIEKWTPLETNTPFYPQRSSTSFQDAVAGRYWRAQNASKELFTAELLISPTTSAPIAVLTMPSKRTEDLKRFPGRQTIDSAPELLKPSYVSIVETPRNLLSPVIPPGAGFALVQRDGSVLYHSDHERILNENLFRETEYSRALMDAIRMQSEGPVEGRYRGNNVAFYVRPIHEVVGIPWTVVVFGDIEPWQALAWQVGLDVLLLYVLSWFLPALAFQVVLSFRMWRKKSPWNACRIAALRYFWPKDSAAERYQTALAFECALIIVFLILFTWFGQRPDGAAGTILLISALLLPIAALAAWTWSIRGTSNQMSLVSVAAEQKPKWRAVYVAAVCSALVGSSVLPIAGFFYLAVRMESEIDLRHWQWDLTDSVLEHRASAQADVRLSNNLGQSAKAIALKLILPELETGRCDNEQLYQSWADTTIRCQLTAPPEDDTPWWSKVVERLRARTRGLDPQTASVGKLQNVTRSGSTEFPMALSRPGAPNVVVESKLWKLTLLPRSLGWWMFAAALLASGCGWVWSASSRLFLFDFHEVQLRRLQQLKGDDLKHPILVLGLPRSGKDRAVSEFIDRVEANSARKRHSHGEHPKALRKKLDLKADKLDEAWLEQALQDIGLADVRTPRAVTGTPLRPAQTAVTPGVASDAAAPPSRADIATLETDRGVSSTLRLAATAGTGVERKASLAVGSVRPPEGTKSQLTDGSTPLNRAIPDYVHVTNLEAAVYDRSRRDIAMRLLDSIVCAPAASRPKLLVTSVVDPVFHFDIIFPDQKDEVERSQLPEAEFGRWAHVFLQFERVLAEENHLELEQAKNAIKKGPWGDELWEECRHHRSLRLTGKTIAQAIVQRVRSGELAPTHEELVGEVQEKAFPLYKLFWLACTRPEKLLLVQLAQTGLVNPICEDTLHDLIRKKLVILKQYPRVMNESFTRFLQSATTSEQITAWEKEAGESHWLTVRNVLIIMVIFVFLMIGITQDRVLQSISGILTAVVGGLGGMFKLTEMIASKLTTKQTNTPVKP
jgi:hypothetical protein